MNKLLMVLFVFCIAFGCMGEVLPLVPGESLVPLGSEREWSAEGLNGTVVELNRWFNHAIMMFRFPDGKEKAHALVSREYDDLETGDFDQFVWFLRNNGHAVTATLHVTTENGVVSSDPVEVSGESFRSPTDIVVDLAGAQFVKKISLECVFTEPSRERTSILRPRLMLRNKNEFQAYVNYWKRFDDIKWEGLLKSESYQPTYQLSYGMMFDQEALDAWREKHIEDLSEGKMPGAPEKAITPGPVEPRGWEFDRMGRFQALRWVPQNLAFRAILFQNPEFMRMAARYLLSLCTAESWNDAIYPVPISGDRREEVAFRNSDFGWNAAFALDCVGEMLTPRGRNYVLKMMMYKGFMPTTYSLWVRTGPFKNNQGPSFIRGKLACLLIAERHWERVKPYTDLAKADLDEPINHMFEEDGSYMEGSTGYLNYTISTMTPAYINFAAMRGKALSEVVPPGLGNAGAIAELLYSTSKHPDRVIIPYGNRTSARNFPPERLAFMALANPDSMWVNLLNQVPEDEIEKALKQVHAGRGIYFSYMYNRAKELDNAEPKGFVLLENMGMVSSWRDSTKILFIGDADGMGKKAQDVGAFVLEYEGDIYAAQGRFGGSARNRNMLVARDSKGDLANSTYLYGKPVNPDARRRYSDARDEMRPKAVGDNVKFHGTVDASKSWPEEYFKKWVRTVDSPNPREVNIIDEYVLGEDASGAVFFWTTILPCEVDGNKIIITGEYGSKCEITAPADCKITLEEFLPLPLGLTELALPEGHKCTRIMIERVGSPGDESRMEVKVRMLSAEG